MQDIQDRIRTCTFPFQRERASTTHYNGVLHYLFWVTDGIWTHDDYVHSVVPVPLGYRHHVIGYVFYSWYSKSTSIVRTSYRSSTFF